MWSLRQSLLLLPLVCVLAGSPIAVLAQDTSQSGWKQTIRLRSTQTQAEPAQPPLSPQEMEALNLIALAIDRGLVQEMTEALAALNCLDGCGPLLDGQWMLHRAARDSTPDVVGMLLSAGASPNLRIAPLGWTPLLTALAAARPENARVLVESGADTTLVGLDGTNAPFMAELMGLGTLIPYPPLQLTTDEASQILLLAVEANDAEAIRLALSAGADPRTTSPENGWSALMIASFNGYFEVAKVLLAEEWGATIDLVSYAEPAAGMTAVHAVLLGADPEYRMLHSCTLALLLANGASVDTVTRAGLTVEDVATNTGTVDVLNDANPPRIVARRCVESIGVEDEGSELVDAVEIPAVRPSVGRSAFAVQNSNVRPNEDGSGDPIHVLAIGDAVELLTGYDPELFMRIRLKDGREGFVRGRLLSLEPVEAVQYGAACLDILPRTRNLIVSGLPSQSAAEAALESKFGFKCERIRTFSGEECVAVVARAADAPLIFWDSAQNSGQPNEVKEAKVIQDAKNFCRSNYPGAVCREVASGCARP